MSAPAAWYPSDGDQIWVGTTFFDVSIAPDSRVVLSFRGKVWRSFSNAEMLAAIVAGEARPKTH